MWEYEFYNEDTGETRILTAYSIRDLHERYPDFDFENWKLVYKEYVD